MIPSPLLKFVEKVKTQAELDPRIQAVAVGGSWLSKELDEFSDLDLLLVGEEIKEDERVAFAVSLGGNLNFFSGDHVGVPELLICLYEDPLLHVDLKFTTLEKMRSRIENPEVLWERDGALTKVLEETKPHTIHANLQWMEDRFWTWIHYAAQRLGRGEIFEVLDMLAFLRSRVLGPLLSAQAGLPVRGVRKLERIAKPDEMRELQGTVASYSPAACELALKNAAKMYLGLRETLAPLNLKRNRRAEMASLRYLHEVCERVSKEELR